MTQSDSTHSDWLSVIRRRFHSVQDSLVALQETRVDSKSLHDARVACRRAEAVLRITRDLLPSRRVVWLQRHLQKLRRACGSARDNDVLRKWLADQSNPAVDKLRKSLKRTRHADQSRIIELTSSLTRRHRFAHQVKRACHAAAGERELNDWRPFVPRRLLDELNHFERAFPAEANSSRQLHQLRIAGKRLRYACEFVSEIIPDAGLAPLHELLSQIQDRLGRLHDTVVRRTSLKQLAHREVHTALLRETAAERDRLTSEWRDYWASISPEATIGSATTKLLEAIRHP